MDREFGQKAADFIKLRVGSWPYVLGFNIVFSGWIIINEVMYFLHFRPFDPYPYILLNLFLSYLAGVTGPLIMVSQNRQDQIQAEQQRIQKQMLSSIAEQQEMLRQTLTGVMHLMEAFKEMLQEQGDVLERLDDNSEEILGAIEENDDAAG